MAKHSRRGRGGDRRLHLAHNAKAPTPRGAAEADPATAHLALEVRSRLRGDDPLDLLAYVSTLVVAAERPPTGVGHPTDEVDLRLLVETFVSVDIAETTALLAVLGHLTRDDELRVLARRALMTRRQPMPLWLRDLDETEITDAAMMTEVAGDGFDIVLGIRWPGGRLASFLVYVDPVHGVVKDAFPTPEPFPDVVRRLRDLAEGIDLVRLEPISLGEARATVEGATDRGEAAADPFESDTWPSARPMLRWLLERMPFTPPGADDDGLGQHLLRQANDESQAASVVEHFLGSSEAARIDFDDESACDAHCLGLVAAFAVGPGDPRPTGWNPDLVKVLFGDWLLSRFLFEDRVARRLPEVVRAFVRWSLRSEDAPAALQRQTLRVVDREAVEFVALATSSEAQVLIAALRDYEARSGLAAVGDIDIVSDNTDNTNNTDDPDDDNYTEFVLDTCAELVGGRTALLDLDDDPLPDEAFRWAGVPDDVRPRVAEVLALIDTFATDCFDVEFRTVCRRLLALVVAGDPDIFRRRGRADTAAAAVGWIAAKANHLISTRNGMAAAELAGRFGIKGSPSGRAQVFLSAIGAPGFIKTSALGRADLLTSVTRASLIRRRELALADDY